jgi:NAD(P)-dependent dehydrogenase (short-subunit alcohol dehydrogenase family)
MIKGMQGKVALVTGGASGIGKVTAQAFAREGVKVIVSTDANIQGAEETVRLIKEAGGEATFIKCDVKKAEEVESMVSRTVETYGSLDYAFNNAGIGPDGKRVPVFPIPDCPEEIWNRTLDTNLKGVWLCMKYEIRQMIKQKRGVIVNTSSVGALRCTLLSESGSTSSALVSPHARSWRKTYQVPIRKKERRCSRRFRWRG